MVLVAWSLLVLRAAAVVDDVEDCACELIWGRPPVLQLVRPPNAAALLLKPSSSNMVPIQAQPHCDLRAFHRLCLRSLATLGGGIVSMFDWVYRQIQPQLKVAGVALFVRACWGAQQPGRLRQCTQVQHSGIPGPGPHRSTAAVHPPPLSPPAASLKQADVRRQVAGPVRKAHCSLCSYEQGHLQWPEHMSAPSGRDCRAYPRTACSRNAS